MKKLIAMMLTMMMLIPAVVYACDGVLPKAEGTSGGISGEVWVALEKSTSCLFGMLSPDEAVPVYPAQTASGKYARGITARGVTRVKGAERYMVIGGGVCGLTKVGASVRIAEEYAEIVCQIVARRMGEDAEMNAANVIACTLYRTDATMAHMMAGTKTDRIAVGGVLFAGAAMEAGLYVTDWNGDGLPDIVFEVNPGDPAKATATPEPQTTPVPGKPTPAPTKKPCNGNGHACVTNIQINFGVVFNWFQQAVNSVINNGKKCGGK